MPRYTAACMVVGIVRKIFHRLKSRHVHEVTLDDDNSRIGANGPCKAAARKESQGRIEGRSFPAFSCYAAQNFGFPGSSVLIELRLENYAVIDNLVVEFGQGLNLLTGETGAGKSILIDALALLLGEKASSEVIRTEQNDRSFRQYLNPGSGREAARQDSGSKWAGRVRRRIADSAA